jgi:CRISPR-associated protein Cst2
MSDKKPVYSLSISGRATLDMHSLNNEGGEGNQITTRMVNIIGADGQLHNVNAISGDMFKRNSAKLAL